jgi:putative transposase
MQRRSRGLRELCRLLGYSSQAYYQYQNGLTKRTLKEELVIHQVLHHRHIQPRIGVRKLLVMLQPFMQVHEMFIGRDVFFDLLRANGLLVKRSRPLRPRTTFSTHWLKKYPDLVKGRKVNAAGELWVSDITY